MSTRTNFIGGGSSIQAEVFQPPGAPNGGAILIAHGSDGLVDNANGPWLTMITGYAHDLAEKGFIVLIPHYFGENRLVDFSLLSNYQAILADAVAYAKTLPGVEASRVGLLGFSLGGYLCLRNRSLTKALVEFFAPLFPEAGGIGPLGNAGLHAQIHHGGEDRLLKYELNALPIEKQLRMEGAEVTAFSYKAAGHGFSGKQPGDAAANKEAKERILAFFEKNL